MIAPNEELERLIMNLQVGYSKTEYKEVVAEGIRVTYPVLEVNWKRLAQSILTREQNIRQERKCFEEKNASSSH